MLETYLAKFTTDETKKEWKNSQFGGRKGSSTDHVLVELWDKVFTGLDNGNKVALLAGIVLLQMLLPRAVSYTHLTLPTTPYV